MTELYLPNGRDGYVNILRHVILRGHRSEPRGMSTWDAGEVTIILASPYAALPLATGRNLSRRIAAAEAVQLIGGFSLPSLLPSSFDRFKEDDGSFYGAYGTRIGDQLQNAVRKLRSDRDSRQAVITLWHPGLDNVDPPKRDHPCTVALGLRIFRDQLRMHALMRSSDAWLGIPYDLFQFTQLQLSVANVLDIEPGPYTHTTWSLHLYDEHLPLVDQVHEPNVFSVQPCGIGDVSTHDVDELQRRALAIGYKRDRIEPTESERWYVDALR